jgi:hypothetical protein
MSDFSGHLRVCLCRGGPYDGKTIALDPTAGSWRGEAFLLDTPRPGDDERVMPPEGGTYRLDETGTYLRWIGT